MTHTETLRLALEALENLGNHDRVCPQWPTYAEPENYPKCNCGYDQAITAIKAALEAKDEPWEKFCDSHCVWTNHHPDCKLAQRTWVGLTDDEIVLIVAECAASHQHTDIHFAKAIEAKLKEKNT